MVQSAQSTLAPNHSLSQRYAEVRALSVMLAAPLSAEDQCVQSMEDASPTKWHLAHTSWFYETFILSELSPGYRLFDPGFKELFNSYYNGVGDQFPRARRGLLTRPGLGEVHTYRRHVDEHMTALLDSLQSAELSRLTELGLNHEQQHQELSITDIKHALSFNPTHPVYCERRAVQGGAPDLSWLEVPEGLYEVGHAGEAGQGFCFDNETPRHRTFLRAFRFATQPVAVGDYLQFLEDGGYGRPDHWLSDGWSWVQREAVRAPLYWQHVDGDWCNHTLSGMLPLDLAEPVCHLNYYEADAYASWAGRRLPTEAEWEVASRNAAADRDVLDPQRLHPRPLGTSGLASMFGGVWEWTSSAYGPYPGFKPLPGTVGEYNGKFMCDQHVLRGGSCATPEGHVRPSYRNFFPARARWQFSGLRLAEDG